MKKLFCLLLIAVFFTTVVTQVKAGPVIKVLGLNPVTILMGSVYTEPDKPVTAWNIFSGENITGKIVRTGLPLNTAVPGKYKVTYSVSGEGGNFAHKERVIIVVTPVIGKNPAKDSAPPVNSTLISKLSPESLGTVPLRKQIQVGFGFGLDFTGTSGLFDGSEIDPSNPYGFELSLQANIDNNWALEIIQSLYAMNDEFKFKGSSFGTETINSLTTVDAKWSPFVFQNWSPYVKTGLRFIGVENPYKIGGRIFPQTGTDAASFVIGMGVESRLEDDFSIDMDVQANFIDIATEVSPSKTIHETIDGRLSVRLIYGLPFQIF